MVNSMDEARNSFTDDDSRSLTKVYLKFPTPRDSEERHTAKPICKEDDEVTLPYDYFDITNNHTSFGRLTQYYVTWQVCRLDFRPKKRGKEQVDQDAGLSRAQRKMKERREAAAKAREDAKALLDAQARANAARGAVPYPDTPMS